MLPEQITVEQIKNNKRSVDGTWMAIKLILVLII